MRMLFVRGADEPPGPGRRPTECRGERRLNGSATGFYVSYLTQLRR
jgi:hypothetical protein